MVDSKVNKKRVVKGSKARSIIKTATDHPELSSREIGKLVECSHVNVIKTLNRYGIDRGRVKDFLTSEEEIEAGLQERLISGITDDQIQKLSIPQRVTSYAILADKRHQRKSAGNHGVAIQININGDPRTIEVEQS